MIYLILILSAVLRILTLDQSLWLDEAITVVNAKNLTFWDFIVRYPMGDFHPPGYFSLIWVWTHFFGFSEIIVRVPSLILGVATVWVTFLLGKEVFDKKTATLAALFMALSPLHVYYSQEARMYSLAAFVTTLSFYFLIKKNWFGYVLSGTLVLYADYLPYLILPAQLIYIIWCERSYLKKVFLCQVLSFIFLIPWLFIFPSQLLTGTHVASAVTGWAKVVGGADLKQLILIPAKIIFGRVSLDNQLIYGGLVTLGSILYGFIVRPNKLLFLWITVPTVLAFLISFYIPVLSYFRLLFILPAVYLSLARGVFSQGLVGLICLISIASLFFYYTNPQFQRENWKETVFVVEQKAKNGGVILFEDYNLPAPFIYYSQNLAPAVAGLGTIRLASKDVYLFEYLVDINDPQRLLEGQIKNKGYQEVEILNFDGVGFVRHFKLQ